MKRRLSDEEYLHARGWVEGGRCWFDPRYVCAPTAEERQDSGTCSTKVALIVQLARDAEEERRVVGDAIANAASRHCKNYNGSEFHAFVCAAADCAGAEYHSRFGRDAEFEMPEPVAAENATKEKP